MASVDVYISERHKKQLRRRRCLALCLVFGILYGIVLAAGWIVFQSPLFSVREITVSGNQQVSVEEMLTLLQSRVFKGSFLKHALGFHNILVWPEELTADDLRFLPELKRVTIQKQYAERMVSVRVEERQPFGIWCLQSRGCFWFDSEGVIFERSLMAEGNLIRVVADYSRDNLGLYSKILPQELIPNLFSALEALAASGVSVKEIRLEDIGLEEIRVTTHDGPDLYFSLRFPSASAIPVIESLRGKPEFKNLKYIDFRSENRAYYK